MKTRLEWTFLDPYTCLYTAGVTGSIRVPWPVAFGAVQWLGALYLAWIGARMITAKAGDAPIVNIRPRQYFRQAMLITLLNPKAIVFYMAFFPLFVDPARHQGLVTFAVMAVTIAALTLTYCVIVATLTLHLADRLRSSPRIAQWLNRIAGSLLIGFGVKLALSK